MLARQEQPIGERELLQVALERQRSGHLDEAAQGYQHLLQRNPHDVNALHLLGTVHLQRGSADQAAHYIRQAIGLQPRFAMAHANLGVALRSLGDLPAAIESYRRALELNPSDAATWLNLSVALLQSGDPAAALTACDRALALKGRDPTALATRGHALLRLLQYEEALQTFEQALQLRPLDAELHLACAQIFRRGARPAQALEAFRRARELNGALQLPSADMIFMRMQLCDWSEREHDTLLARQGELQPPIPPLAILGLFDDPGLQLSSAIRWGRHFFQPPAAAPVGPDQFQPRACIASPRRLRLGYLSADFRDHIVTHAIVKLLEQHARESFELTALSLCSDDGSAARRRLLAAMDDSLDLTSLSDAEAARAIRGRKLDIVIDLGGYSADARPGILLHRAAPIQASYLGYPATLGNNAADYLICDRHVIPPDCASHYSERLAQLPECFMPYDTSRTVAASTRSRSQERLPEEALVLCSFNAPWKIGPRIFAIWMRLLSQLPDSVLWLRDGEGVANNLRREAAAHGVTPERLVFAHREPDEAVHLGRHSLADLFLDTWPYNAHQTACDALWAGLPVLTYSGRSYPSRVAGSLLRTAGLPELVCGSLEEYEQRALTLCRDRTQLSQLRERVRAARGTPLFDMSRLCRHLEQAYLQMWHHYANNEQPHSFNTAPLP